MYADFSEEEIAKISMIKHVQKAINKGIEKTAPAPSSNHLFQIRHDKVTERLGTFLPEEQAIQFHHSTFFMGYWEI